MVLSTFLTDLFLSLVSLSVAYRFVGKSAIPSRSALYGFAIIGISAGLGAVHFLGFHALDDIYRFFVGLAGCLGVPLLGLAFFHFSFRSISEKTFFLFIGVLFGLYLVFSYVAPLPIYSTVVGGIAMAIVLLSSIIRFPKHANAAILGIVGAVLFILAGLVIGTKGSTGPILNVDIFHVLLAIANYCIGQGISKLS
ncbi:Hypothetical protein LBF_2776 [Leptospira biflexa serovar Patoc strain 'Patoc 1 (Ames)']|uniref:Uncharacterized protein n=1 Tax=Leptospira biflexa serovar Patoc (strain Patoc 1 / ATCC 23582 / Paris) TaxID=456481 RepID=B0SNH9_LEPBP|nr:hypothetical protein [Leptospira biflexa]ABZ95256.1 Hypothetical protein LBF_2776 [Leptospira biflexa serovar Patoc strain 'Patoc 1 (Ames)']ABZ98946.1 Conserved hypothetical protein; putative membrane protein [Leptospira biflexa serovar Patoc strain 'Patoc 1 (Paris)']